VNGRDSIEKSWKYSSIFVILIIMLLYLARMHRPKRKETQYSASDQKATFFEIV